MTPRNARTILLEKGHAPGHLVVTQNDTPGWRAWVDGKSSGIALADGIFQAIEVSPEAKVISLAYEPSSFRLGLFGSLVGLMVLVFLRVLRRKGN
jgi:uncharacterized membrane protein YfhO